MEKIVISTFKGKYKTSINEESNTCLLPISVGQLYHENEMFSSTMDLVNKTFSKCIIVVCDLLQIYNQLIYNPTITKAEAYQKALIQGDSWIAHNQKYLDKLSIPYQLIRWKVWLEHPQYCQRRQEIRILYEEDQEIKEAIDQTVEIFYERFTKHIHDLSLSKADFFMLSKEYIEEECAIMPLWIELCPKVLLYPKNIGTALSKILERFVLPNQTGFLQPIALKFKRKAANTDYFISKVA